MPSSAIIPTPMPLPSVVHRNAAAGDDGASEASSGSTVFSNPAERSLPFWRKYPRRTSIILLGGGIALYILLAMAGVATFWLWGSFAAVGFVLFFGIAYFYPRQWASFLGISAATVAGI